MITQDAATEASFIVLYKLAKRNKPFSDGEFIKECMSDEASIMCPEHKTKLNSIALSRRTVVRRVQKISDNLMNQLKDTSKQFLWYSLALDESNDVQDTAQLLVFIRGMDANFQLTEELFSVESLKDTTTGKDIQNFAYIWLHKGNQNEFLKHLKIKWLDGGLFWMLKEFILISFMKPDVRKTLNIIISGT